ncbi:hypothetical protein [Mucilaginibacter sp. KACC 22063]|uniref:hypothetical protein n=1 Tax=Mucilaginibacter sp. KACC 22063 TaxID=3025666 RepID=UPI002365F838|nr:hypothetical protein [Mucilaginibacter sp. KACC 22063]WDF55827.1 hypothetical protein PQ461_01970 [Mucilaginibacter sp. KACC 22063]
MKKTLILTATMVILFLACCKKENNSQISNTTQQLEQLMAKYPNLKLLTRISTSQNISPDALKSLDDSLSKFSELLKGVSISNAMLNTDAESQSSRLISNVIHKDGKLSTNDYGQPVNQ